jgi:hypothetical protein
MIFAFRFHQELADKTKTANPSGRRFASPAEIFGEFSRRTSAGTFIPAQGTVASTARLPDLLSEVIPDVHQNGIIITRICNWIFALPAPFHARARARGSATLRNRCRHVHFFVHRRKFLAAFENT